LPEVRLVPIFCSDRSGTEAQLGGCRENFAHDSAVKAVKAKRAVHFIEFFRLALTL